MSKGISTLLAFFFAVAAAWAQDRPTLYAQRDHGIPAIPYEVTYQQPNGQTVRVNLKGDGAAHWAITPDGYKLVKNQEGAFCYAVEDATKGMKASNIIASDISSRTSSEKTLLKSLNKSITYNPTYIERKKASRSLLKAGEKPQKAFPTKGNRKLLCILVSYQDIKFQKTQAEFNDLFNKQGYNTNGATGSVRDYFYDNSFQQMNLTVDVVGPVTISKSRASYGGNNADGDDTNPEAMVTEAVKLADQSGVDFSQYDNDKDGTIDGVYVIFAGNGEEAGASADAIWSHAWRIPTLRLDGVYVSSYSCSPELYGTSRTTITSIGVICHEFSHVCGLPDYYDTDYGKSGGESENLGDFDIMSGGSWNNNGRTPPFTNSYSRYMLGWGELKNFNNKNLNTITPHYSTPYAYWTSTKNNEWFVFENRQQTKWDTFIPGHGMVVYHIVYDAARWSENTINIDPNKELFQLVDAQNTPNSAYSTFPGNGNVHSISSTTTPAIKNWDGSSLNTSLANITETKGNITLDVNAIQSITFTILSNKIPVANATILIGDKSYTTDMDGVVSNVVVKLYESRTFTVSKAGYLTYTGNITAEDNTSIQINLRPDEFTVAPNPIAATEPLRIYSKTDVATAYIYNLNGSLLQTAMLSKGQNTVDRSMLNSGVYLVKIESSEGTFKTKIVIL